MKPRAEEVAARTPPERDRFIDFLRAASIMLVVLGHWLVVAIEVRGDTIHGEHVLDVVPWTHPLTWLFQVIPVFFMVGGFANAMSWESERREGSGQWVPWVLRRTQRLLRPTTLFLAVGVVTAVAAVAAGADRGTVDEAGWLVNVALWFLAVYAGIAAAAPMLLALHERWGVRVLALLVAGVAVVDVARLGFGVPYIGLANFALAWLALHQLGFLLRDGTLTRSRLVPPALGVGGILLVAGLTIIGPYPVSMVNVPGAEFHNAAPPTFALVALGFAQAGIVLTVRPAVDRWLRRPMVWLAVVTVNAVILTIYLWQLVPLVAVALVQRETGFLPQPEIGSGAWWALRPAWVAILAVLLLPIVAVAGRFERRAPRSEPAREGRYGLGSMVAAGAGILMASGGIAAFTIGGMHGDGPLGLPLVAIALYAPALGLLRLARGFGTQPRSR